MGLKAAADGGKVIGDAVRLYARTVIAEFTHPVAVAGLAVSGARQQRMAKSTLKRLSIAHSLHAQTSPNKVIAALWRGR